MLAKDLAEGRERLHNEDKGVEGLIGCSVTLGRGRSMNTKLGSTPNVCLNQF